MVAKAVDVMRAVAVVVAQEQLARQELQVVVVQVVLEQRQA